MSENNTSVVSEMAAFIGEGLSDINMKCDPSDRNILLRNSKGVTAKDIYREVLKKNSIEYPLSKPPPVILSENVPIENIPNSTIEQKKDNGLIQLEFSFIEQNIENIGSVKDVINRYDKKINALDEKLTNILTILNKINKTVNESIKTPRKSKNKYSS